MSAEVLTSPVFTAKMTFTQKVCRYIDVSPLESMVRWDTVLMISKIISIVSDGKEERKIYVIIAVSYLYYEFHGTVIWFRAMHSSVRDDNDDDNEGDLNNNEDDNDDSKNYNNVDDDVSTCFVQTKSTTLIKDSKIVFGWQLSVSARKYAVHDFVCKQETSSLLHTSLVLNRNYLLLLSTLSEWRQS